MTKQQYDQIAEKYTGADNTVEGVHIVKPTFLELCKGHIEGRSVVDLACGSGNYTRVLKELGAKRVVGIDISDEQIRIAREKEAKAPTGIEYQVGDVAKYNVFWDGQFDVAVAVFLLDYAQDRENLRQMCRNTYLALRRDGVFLAIVDNPDAVLPTDKKYQVALSFDADIHQREGCERRVTFYRADGSEDFHFYNWYWERRTYEEVLLDAGFVDASWRSPIISKQRTVEFGEEFWDSYRKNPNHAGLVCRK